MHILLAVLTFLVVFVGLLLWVALGTGAIVLIVCAVDGCRYGGPRFNDWRDPVLTLGGVFLFVAVYMAAAFELMQLMR